MKTPSGESADPSGPGRSAESASPAPDPAADPNLIRVFDPYGRELYLTREQWRTEVLPANLEKAKDDPDALASMIMGALRDGFAEDVVAQAEHLHRSDTTPARGATLLGVVYLEMGRQADAERVLKDHLARHGEDPYVLTNLAKAQDVRGDHRLAEDTLWRALELDPNQDSAFAWYVAMHHERAGEAGYLEACSRVARLPSSWRAQVWLARDALQRGDLAAALSLYEESLSRAGEPAPGELLVQLSGDLGNAGHLEEIVSVVAPEFDAVHHGIEVGNNLIKANLDLGRLDDAKRIIEQLYAQDRPDWRPHLEFWDAEVARARVEAAPPVDPAPPSMALLSLEGPLWLRAGSPCSALLEAKPEEAPRIAFFGSTALVPDAKDVPRVQLADAPGRLSRALPLVMAEQVHLESAAAGVALIPWFEGSGFALFGTPYEDADLCRIAQSAATRPALIGGIVVDARQKEWRASMRLLRVSDRACVGAAEVPVHPGDPGPAVEQLTSRLTELLRDAGQGANDAPSWYRRPGAAQSSNYLLRLEQQLAVICDGFESLHGGRLNGEHEIVEGAIGLCLQEPESATTRALLAQTLRQMKRARPEIIAQYQARAELLQREHPIPGEAGSCISKALAEVFTAA